MNKKGISLVALVITIIVLIILTAAVVITGINVPANAEKAVKDYNLTVVQDAVTLYVMNEMFKSIESFVPTTTGNTKTVSSILEDVIYTTNATDADKFAGSWSGAQAALDITLSDTELNSLFKLDTSTGKVYLKSDSTPKTNP